MNDLSGYLPFTPRPGSAGTTALAGAESALLAMLLDTIPARLSVIDAGLRYRYANSEALASWGLSAEQVIGRHVADVISPQVFARYAAVLDRVLSGQALCRNGWVDDARRGRRYLQELLVPYAGRDGTSAESVIEFARDLTEFKQQEEALADKLAELRKAEALKSAIVDHAMVAIVSTDDTGRIVEFNPAAESMFGLLRREALGRTVEEVMIPPRHRAAHRAGMARLAQGDAPRVLGRRLEMHALRADGSEFPIEMVLWRTDAGGSVYYTASINDMSERQRAHEVIERQRDALRHSEKLTAMGSLLAGVAHELNNPLAIVLGRASLLEEKAAGTPLADDARRIHVASQRCGRIVRTFLNMARQRPAQRSAVQLNDIVRGAADMLGYTLRSHGITVELSLTEELPTVQADADQIGQVVLNLMVNAQQALSSHEGERHIALATGLETQRRSREPCVWLSVSDTGPGVAPALQATIFDPFFTTKGEDAGTGLGLSVSRAIVRQHGGELRLVDSARGARFRLSLPLSGEALPDTEPAPLEETEATQQLRVLVVDDEAEISELMRDFLESAGYEVASAESGAVALAMLGEARFDVIVSDLRMPDMDGAALWREVKARHVHLARRMLFVTGDTLSPGARSFLAESGCASLDKPFTKQDLISHLQALATG